MAPLTAHLKSLHKDLFEAATQHKFLEEAAKGTLAPEKLASWLVQDEHYQHAYVPFIGQVLATLRGDDQLPSTIFLSGQERTDKVENHSLQHRIVDALVSAIQTLRVEETFFATTIRDYGLTKYATPTAPVQGTEAYLNFFQEVGSSGSLLNGLTLLWATEFVYLSAWKFAGTQTKAGADSGSGAEGTKNPVNAVPQKFIPNWTSSDFEAFVNQLGDLLDEVAEAQGQGRSQSAEEVWKRVLRCEVDFWPDV